MPLPGLVTTDGQQQYLTNRKGTWLLEKQLPWLNRYWASTVEGIGFVGKKMTN